MDKARFLGDSRRAAKPVGGTRRHRLAFVSAVILFQQLLIGGIAKCDSTNLSASGRLKWDAETKELQAKAGDEDLKIFFSVTNVSDSDVAIDRVQTSCGCTIATMPDQPWILKPKDDGKMQVAVDLRGKVGTLTKTITVYFHDGDSNTLTVRIVMPNSSEMQRLRNQQLAAMERQLVFKDSECAHCHLDPARGKTGRELFATACGICHESPHRATMVPDLHALNHATDKVYWKQWITAGKPGSLMPGFGAEFGGPLDSAQIDSLVDYLWNTMPHGH
jgi:hypothetical protein